MLGLPLAFGAPLVLIGLALLPVIWWLLRLTPPRPRDEVFPPTRILERLAKREETPATSPWWLTLLRLALAALVILALAQPIWRPLEETIDGGDGPVMIVMDNAWTAARDWDARVETATRLIGEAENAGRPVTLVPTVGVSAETLQPTDAATARERLGALEPRPVPPEAEALATGLGALTSAPGTIVWLSDGLATDPALAQAMRDLGGPAHVFAPDIGGLVVAHGADNAPEAMRVSLARPPSTLPQAVTVRAFDVKSRPLGEASTVLAGGATTATVDLDMPVELRNDIARIDVAGSDHAGAVVLLDERFRRRRVGLLSGGNADNAQPLLSPLYYISRALAPFADVRQARSANIVEAVPQLIEEGASALVLADIGTLPREATQALTQWVETGGMLIRFAGPRLAAAEDADDPLVPVRLRRGGRQLGGALTWEQPQSLAAFDESSPFAGLTVPPDVTVSRQVLAEPGLDLAERTWASLADGTPLVTATQSGQGYIVLVHVTADASWSNLALSGSFVDMLRRLVAVSSGALAAKRTAEAGGSAAATAEAQTTALPPLRLLNGSGELVAPPAEAKPLVVRTGVANEPSAENPPGLYGTNDAFQALNLFADDPNLRPLDVDALGVTPAPYETEAPLDIKPWLLALAALLLALDCLAVLWMAGALRFGTRRAAALALLASGLFMAVPQPSHAQSADTSLPPEIASTLRTRLAYVETGNANIDTISRKGMGGLTRFIASRTALEPGEPAALDLATDELAFYPLIYWPVDASIPAPDADTMARVDAFMKRGGTVLFDTRDQATSFGGVTPATQRLREILSSLDVPALEPVPENHVMTRAFYLLEAFPGRYQGGQLWVEASAEEEDRPARRGDGVSSIMITSNDFAGAWALEPNGGFTLPTVPGNPRQRTLAYRVGVNIAMYTLTGNYKADQVHVPALLERLGQ